MLKICMTALAAATLVSFALPVATEAQVGNCMICDYTLIVPCAGALRGAEQCATQAPDDCDLYGAVCGDGFAILLPDGSVTSTAVDQLLGDLHALRLSTGEVPQTLIRGCNDEILLRIPAEDVARQEHAATMAIVI